MENYLSPSEAQALQVVEAFVATSTLPDQEAHARTFNLPHVRIAGGTVTVWQNLAEWQQTYPAYVASIVEPNRAYVVVDRQDVIQSSDSKVHIAAQFTRYDRTHTQLATYQTLYVVTCVAGHWGIQARSSFAP
jgi:hypothetical protein